MFSFLKTWFNFFYKRRAKELLLSSPAVKPASRTFALKQKEGTSGDKPQISTSHTNYRPSYHDILLTFCLSPTMKNRHSLSQNDSHGQFYKTNRRHRVSPSPSPAPHFPSFPLWASLSPLSRQAGANNQKDISHPRQWCSACQGPCLLWRKSLTKWIFTETTIIGCQVPLRGDRQRSIFKKGFLHVVSHCPVVGTDPSSVLGLSWVQAYHSLSLSLLTSMLGTFHRVMNNFIYRWRVNSEMY